MADVHERCLNAWIERSRNALSCEICKSNYAIVGDRWLPLRDWTKPEIGAMVS